MNSNNRLRTAVGQLADAAPTPPSWEGLEKRLLPPGTPKTPIRRVRVRVALVAAAVLALLALPAVGAVGSWLTGAKDPDAPTPLGPDVVLASGVAGATWEIVATPSDQGPCVLVRVDAAGLGGCGPSDVRGDPTAQGSTHWVQGGNGSGGVGALTRSIVHGWAAAEVTSVELVLMDGGSATTELVMTPGELGGAPKFFWAALPCGSSQCVDTRVLVRSLVARDASGNILETREVHDPKAASEARSWMTAPE
jgi:hypothetical protein